MILHLVTKHFVSNRCLSVFENRAPGQNIILVIGSMPNSVEYVDNSVEVTSENEVQVVNSLDFKNITHVVVHYLTPKIVCFIQKYVPEGLPIFWWTYGGDLYQPYLERRGYDVFYTDLTPFKSGWVYMTYRYVLTCKSRFLYKLRILRGDKYMQTSFLDRVDGIIPCIPPDHEMACKYLKRDYKLVRIHPNGCPPFDEGFYNGNVVSIGHSASYTGNHLYALKYLSKVDVGDSKLSLTLSYNFVSNKYVEAVKKRFKQAYKEKVNFIEKRVSKEDFFKSQNELKILILPTWRQEALASVYSCFLRGVKLFLSKKGPMYEHFLNYGFKVFALENLNQVTFDTPLTIEEKKHNRELTLKYLEEKGRLVDEDFKLYFGDYYKVN